MGSGLTVRLWQINLAAFLARRRALRKLLLGCFGLPAKNARSTLPWHFFSCFVVAVAPVGTMSTARAKSPMATISFQFLKTRIWPMSSSLVGLQGAGT
jgi:hypothetical protein